MSKVKRDQENDSSKNGHEDDASKNLSQYAGRKAQDNECSKKGQDDDAFSKNLSQYAGQDNECSKKRQDDDAFSKNLSHAVDAAYAGASERDTKICLSTSTPRHIPFLEDLSWAIPNAEMLPGGQDISDIIQRCCQLKYTDVVWVGEVCEMDLFVIMHLPYGPIAYFQLFNVVTRKGRKPKGFPHVIVDNFTTEVQKMISTMFKHLFRAPEAETDRVVTFANQYDSFSDFISFRHHMFRKDGNVSVELKELGPSFELRLYKHSPPSRNIGKFCPMPLPSIWTSSKEKASSSSNPWPPRKK